MSFQDISLKHLTSIEAKKGIVWWAIILGVIFFISSIYFPVNIPDFIKFSLTVSGIGLTLIGIFTGGKQVVFIADSGKTITVKLKRSEQIEKIIRTVREYE